MSEEKIVKMFYDLKDSIMDLAKKQNENFVVINKSFENINKRLDEHEKQQEIDFKNIIKRFDQHEQKQRIDLAKLEDNMYDRTKALFDAREISLEKDEDLYSKIKSIDRLLEKHHYRIAELESKVN